MRRVCLSADAASTAAPAAETMYDNCCETGFAGRRYYNRDEKKAWLERYQESLRNELQAVEERLADLGAAA